VVIHHASDDRIVALIEILSAGNKSSSREFQAFVTKALNALDRGYHLLLIDLHRRTDRDPDGIHSCLWTEAGGKPTIVPAEKPLTLVAYDAGPPRTAYVEPVAVEDTLIDMPLFLAPGWYVSVPLEATYQAAWRGVPRRYQEVLLPVSIDSKVSRFGTSLIVMFVSRWIFSDDCLEDGDCRLRHQVHRPRGWQNRQPFQAQSHDDLGDGLLDVAFQLVYSPLVHLAGSSRHEPRIVMDGFQI
jgi:hypothetical protein